MNENDYLGIIALALSDLSEQLADSIESEKVKPVLMTVLTNAFIKWKESTNWETANIKEDFIAEVKSSIDTIYGFYKANGN